MKRIIAFVGALLGLSVVSAQPSHAQTGNPKTDAQSAADKARAEAAQKKDRQDRSGASPTPSERRGPISIDGRMPPDRGQSGGDRGKPGGGDKGKPGGGDKGKPGGSKDNRP